MKKWTKIKLVNWHGFYNETIKINGSVVVTGNNGTGKSTFIDAIIFVLTGGEERYFNSAANVSNSRTVETYMRGKTGEEGSPYLRNDSYLVSHIALEFYDEYKKQYFVLGVVLEIFEGSNKAVRNFYHLNNHRLEEKYYVDGDAYLGINEMKKIFLFFIKLFIVLAILAVAGYYSFNVLMSAFVREKAEVLVPDLQGKNLVECLDMLSQSKLALMKEGSEFNQDVPAGIVIRQVPPAGMNVKEGKVIKIVISQGGEIVYVPDLKGQTDRKSVV